MLTKIKWIVGILMIATMFGSVWYIGELRDENSRLSGNNESLVLNNSQKDGEIRTLYLSKKELNLQLEADSTMKSLLRDSLQMKTKQVKRLTQMVSKSEINIDTQLKDGTYVDTTSTRPDSIIPVKIFKWQDPWTDASGMVGPGDRIRLNIQSNDTILYGAGLKKYKKFFVARWFEKPKIIVKVANTNPHTKIAVKFDAELVK